MKLSTLQERFLKETAALKRALDKAEKALAEQVLYQPTVNTPTRSLNVAFQPHPSRPVLGFYIVSLSAVSSLVGGQSITVLLKADNNATPSIERARGHLMLTQAFGVNANLQSQQAVSLSYLVPAGQYVLLESTGTGAGVLLTSTEIVF